MEDRYRGSSEKGENSAGWKDDKIAAWEQEKYLAEWCRKHEKKSGRKEKLT